MRENYGGLFKMDPQNLTPIDANGVNIAGDFQFIQNTGLIMIHTFLYRFHNMIATTYATHFPQWSNDKIFFETRRIVIACYQHILYYDWLPLVLGM